MVEAKGLVNCPIAAETTADTRTWETKRSNPLETVKENRNKKKIKKINCKQTNFVVQNTADFVEGKSVAGEFRDAAEGRGGRGGGGADSFGETCIIWVWEGEAEQMGAAASESEKLKYHHTVIDWMNEWI